MATVISTFPSQEKSFLEILEEPPRSIATTPRAKSAEFDGSTCTTLPYTTSGNAQALVTTRFCQRAQVSAAEKPNPSTSDGTITVSTAET